MTLSTSGYTLGSNQPLNHARILWSPLTGTITAGGTNGALAANDYTFQRWSCGALPSAWTLETAADAEVDTLFIAAHNLSGRTVTVETSATTGGGFTTRATVTPTDNSVIAVMFNTGTGAPHVIRRVRITVSGSGTDAAVGIIRWGKALQMTRPVFGGVRPIGLARAVETRQAISETGQWLGRMILRQAAPSEMNWEHLDDAWYKANFHPFALSLPQMPFGLIQNPARMPESVGWCWTDGAPVPEYMGVRNYLQVSLPVVGYLG